MAQLRYIGYVDKTLIDVAPLTHGAIISVDDDFATRLLSSFPNEYETVDAVVVEDSTPTQTTKKAAATNAAADTTTSAAAPAATNE